MCIPDWIFRSLPVALTPLFSHAALQLAFVIAALVFILLIPLILFAEKAGKMKLVRTLGILWALTAVPFAVYLVSGLLTGQPVKILVCVGVMLVYIFLDVLLDFILKIDFRSNWKTHAPYILLEYAALIALIIVTFAIDRTWGWIISSAFWILLACIMVLYIPRKKVH